MAILLHTASVGASFFAGVGVERTASLWEDASKPVGRRTLWAGMVAAMFWLFLLRHSRSPADLAPLLIATAALGICTLVDLASRRIPNQVTLTAVPAILISAALVQPESVAERLVYALLLFSFFLAAALLRAGALGMGDVKLVAVVGAGLGPPAIAAVLIGLCLAAVTTLGPVRGRGIGTATVPLAPFLTAGSAVIVVVGG
ncbi:MAG: hypothetical protein F2813_01915 [Actinobacteria bacterium]|uniref:Unannotated protein n=1 Tax=freshwater metagenome TaxID=449393 RepID=A0A6J5Z8B5_9ZZZZ|nr:hypothetical protein [Actinomycetota bacterium]